METFFRQAQTGTDDGFICPDTPHLCDQFPSHPPSPSHTHTHTHTDTSHSYTSSRQCSLAHRCSAWLDFISPPICFTLHLQTNILMDRGWVTRLNFWQGYSVSKAAHYTQRWREQAFEHTEVGLDLLCAGMYCMCLYLTLLRKPFLRRREGKCECVAEWACNSGLISLMWTRTTCVMFRHAKCRTHLLVITPSSSPEMAFLCIPWIVLHQGGWINMCACMHARTHTHTIPLLSKQTHEIIHKWSITLKTTSANEYTGCKRFLLIWRWDFQTPVTRTAAQKHSSENRTT